MIPVGNIKTIFYKKCIEIVAQLITIYICNCQSWEMDCLHFVFETWQSSILLFPVLLFPDVILRQSIQIRVISKLSSMYVTTAFQNTFHSD